MTMNRRKMDISKTVQILAVVFALIGGGLGFWGTTTAKAVADARIEHHDQARSAHYDTIKRVEDRLDGHDVDISGIKRDVAATRKTVDRLEEGQKEILKILRERR